MFGHHNRMRVLVDASNEGDLARGAGIHQPALLMLATAMAGAIPSDFDGRPPSVKEGQLFRRSPECICLEARSDCVGTPEHDSDIKPPCCSAIEYIEEGAASVRHAKRFPEEGDRHPDRRLRGFDRSTDLSEGDLTIHEGIN
jgi:hypothetical protein